VKLFWFTVYHFLWSTFHFFAGDLKFCKLTIHLKFSRLRPSVCKGDSRWFLNAPALRVGSRGGNGGNWPGPLTPRGPRDDNYLFQIKYSFEKLWFGSDTWIQIYILKLQWVGLHLLISLQFSHAASFSNHYWM